MARRLVLALTIVLSACTAGAGVLPSRGHALNTDCAPGTYQAVSIYTGSSPPPFTPKQQNGAEVSICNAQPARVLTSPQPAAALSARTVMSHATGQSNGAPVSIGINGGRAPNALASPTPAATPT